MSFLDHLLMYPSQRSTLLSITVDGCRSDWKFYNRKLTNIPTAVTDYKHGVAQFSQQEVTEGNSCRARDYNVVKLIKQAYGI
jgi:hypothetical protein